MHIYRYVYNRGVLIIKSLSPTECFIHILV